MLDKLKADFDGILELVTKCPANLQEMALKTILEHWAASNTRILLPVQNVRATPIIIQGLKRIQPMCRMLLSRS